MGDVVVAEMIGDLAGGLSGELFDMRGGEADVEVGATEERFGERDGGRETFGDGAGIVARGIRWRRRSAVISGSA